MTVAVDPTCGIQNFGIVPEFIEYSLQVLPPNNNGSPAEEPIVLGVNSFNGAGGPFDALVATVSTIFLNLQNTQFADRQTEYN